LRHYERVLENTVHTKVNFPGAGAGGGLPSSIKALANVTVRPGMDYIIEFTKLEEQLSIADMVITGEGKIDEQTLSGKVVKGVADLAARHNKVVVAFAGKAELSEKAFQSLAIRKIITLTSKDTSEKQAMENAYGLLHDRVAIFWRNWEPEAT
jgi:glycerate kinase